MLSKGTRGFLLRDLAFGIIHGCPLSAGSLGILVALGQSSPSSDCRRDQRSCEGMLGRKMTKANTSAEVAQTSWRKGRLGCRSALLLLGTDTGVQTTGVPGLLPASGVIQHTGGGVLWRTALLGTPAVTPKCSSSAAAHGNGPVIPEGAAEEGTIRNSS